MSENTYWALGKEATKWQRATMTFGDTTAKTLFTLPANSYILDWVINVTTAFNSSGTDLLDLGISGTTQKYAAAVDIAATGLKTTNVVAAQIGVLQTTPQTILGLYTQSVADATTGALIILVRYATPNI